MSRKNLQSFADESQTISIIRRRRNCNVCIGGVVGIKAEDRWRGGLRQETKLDVGICSTTALMFSSSGVPYGRN
jgi:hypothetical protein